MEYANQGDLFQKITDFKENNKSFEEDQIWKMFLHIVKGLKVLHDLKIIHRDLKVSKIYNNIFFRVLMSFCLKMESQN